MQKKIIISVGIIVLVVAAILGIRFLSGKEDAWICQNGAWIRHGNPLAAKPSEDCPTDSANQSQEELESSTLPIKQLTQEEAKDLIRVNSPKLNATVTSPLEITGEARGNWYFEGDFPVELRDSNDKLLVSGTGTAQGEWMTENFVPFRATLSFISREGQDGTLVVRNSNPSGLPQQEKEMRIPVKIARAEGVSVKVFFGMSGMTGNDCEKVFPITRTVPKTQAIGRATLEELLKGPTKEEADQNYISMINPGVGVRSLVIENGIAKVDLSRTVEEGVGGSCRVMAIRSQIEETLKQFNTVKQVVISVEGRTEDVLQP